MNTAFPIVFTLVLALIALANPVAAADGPDMGVDEHLGSRIPGDLVFRDQDGRTVVAGDLIGGDKPTLLIPAYYRCPMLCGLVLQAGLHAAKGMDWTPGDQYRLVTVSFDEEDGPAQARQKQVSVLAGAGGDARFQAATWPFLTTDQATAQRLLAALGEHVQSLDDGEIAHPAVAVVLGPGGKISRYLYGISLQPRDLKLALLEASQGRTGTTLDRVLLFCYRFDPTTHRYGLFIARFLQIGGVLAAILIFLVIVVMVRLVRRRPGVAA